MNLNVFNCFLSCFVIVSLASLVSSASFAPRISTQGEREKAIRTTLLDATARYKNGQAPLKQEVPVEASDARLYEFCPHFVTSDPEVNQIIFSLLNDHFRTSRTIIDLTVFDELELMTLKIFFETELFARYNPIILQYFLCFLHENIYYMNGMAPFSLNDCKIKFIRKLHKYNLPESYAYLMNSDHPGILEFPGIVDIDRNYWNFYNWRRCLTFFYNRPSFDEVKAFVLNWENQLTAVTPKPIEFVVIINELLYSLASEEDLLQAIIFNSSVNAFSPEMFHWYKTLKGNMITLTKSLPNLIDFRLKLAYFEAIKDSLYSDDNLNEPLSRAIYIYSCSYINRFSLRVFRNINADQFYNDIADLAFSKSFNLAQLEMFSKIVSSDVFSNEKIQRLHENVQNNPILLHIMNLESNAVF